MGRKQEGGRNPGKVYILPAPLKKKGSQRGKGVYKFKHWCEKRRGTKKGNRVAFKGAARHQKENSVEIPGEKDHW